MTKYECDRCLKIGIKPLQQITIPFNRNGKFYGKDTDELCKDLCEDCVEELRKWITPLPKPTVALLR